MYIIQDNITGQQLARYGPNPENWGWDVEVAEPGGAGTTIFVKIQVFSTKSEVDFVIDHLNREFQSRNEETDFTWLEVEPVRGYRVKNG